MHAVEAVRAVSEGRSLIFPVAIALGARPLTVPARGAVLVVSAFYPFRLSDGAPVRPATWYETVAAHAGAETVPDSMAPLDGAELLVLGAVAPPARESQEAFVRCGALDRHVVLHRDPAAPDAPLAAGVEAAVWHKEDNPVGRGGPDDERPALIVDGDDPQRPVWFGATPYDHPLRLRRVGTPDEASGTGWPSDADPAVLHDAHPAFWTESFHPGDPLAFDGLSAAALDSRLPSYRISITSGREDGRFLAEHARIHGVSLIPGADLGAMFWRAAIDVGDDILGESVVALIAALEDVDSPAKDPEHWGRIAVNRWLEPDTALDDRPLLPAALAAAVTLPFTVPEDGDPVQERHAAAEAWMRDEMGVGEENPFGEQAPDEVGLADQALEAAESDEAPPDANAIGEIADAALAASKRRHAEAGFKERDPEEERTPQRRGARLEAEIDDRLSRPYRGEREKTLAGAIRDNEIEGVDAGEVLNKLAGARVMSTSPALPWPALEEPEASRFGDVLAERLADEDLERHVDVSGALVAGEHRITGRRLDGLLAEETAWRETVFSRCEFTESSFCGGSFRDCEFQDCSFRRANLTRVELAGCKFVDCTFDELRISEPTWFKCRFERCSFEGVSMSDPAMSETEFEGGSWLQVEMLDGLLIDMTFRGLDMQQVTFAQVHAPQSRLERISMSKVWVMANGFPVSAFEDVEAVNCGFLGHARFDQSSFSRVRFAMTGFTNAVFSDTQFTPGCRFDACDLSGAMFSNVRMDGVRFIECSMASSKWSDVSANDAWFYGARLRGVDFADTELARAVFSDADIEGAVFQPERTIGADFRGTVKGRP